MANNFKAPVTPIFNGEQFELIDGKIISSKGGGSLNIKFKKESASGLYECDKSFEDIKQAIIDFKDINIEFPNEDGTVSYDKWYVKATDNSTTITFASGRYENTLLNERCWIEENVVMPSTYVSGASLALAQNIVYSRDYKIKYDVNDDDYEGAWPSPRLASEIKPFHGDFQFVPADNVTPTGTAGGKAFQGWFYDEGCSEPINFGDVAGVDPDAITHDVRAYAKWKAKVKGVGITNTSTTPNTVAFMQKGWGGYVGYTGTLTMQYSLDGGTTWTDIVLPKEFKTTESALVNITVPPGETVIFRTPTHNERFSSNDDSYYKISLSTGDWVLEGNVMYLVDPTGESKTIENNYQFAHLFEGTPIKEIPEDFLPATTLTERCYGDMFHGSSIESIPDNLLPAETLAKQCYYYMFAGCHNLTSIGANSIKAKTYAEESCINMFNDIGITAIPEGFFDNIEVPAESCCTNMFRGCVQLEEVNAKLPSSLAEGIFSRMFHGCTNLISVPSDMLSATTLAANCYNSMFYNCSSLTDAPELPAMTLTNSCYSSMFYGCTSLTTPPELPAETLDYMCYNNMFGRCTALVNAPALPATTMADSCYQSMFIRCSSLVNAPALPATTLATSCYQGMFGQCTSLTAAPALPATTLATTCYDSMFNMCTALTTAPELPATTLADFCYRDMFGDCYSLNHIEVGATSWNASYARNWVSGVSGTGDFYCPAGTTIGTNTSGIPVGWTRHDV